MTYEEAMFVKVLRDNGYTWRAVAREFHDNFPSHQNCIIRGNQMDGSDLCQFAAKILGEPNDSEWV